mgnify:CR=1 FL=1
MDYFDLVNVTDPGTTYEFPDTRDNTPYPDAVNLASGEGNLAPDYVVDEKGRVVDSAGNVISGPTNASTGTSGSFDLSKLGGNLKSQLTKILTGAQDNPLGGIAGLLLLSQLLNKRDRKSTRLNSSHTDISRMPSSA